MGYGLDSNGTKRGWPHVYGVPKVRTDITVETWVSSLQRIWSNRNDLSRMFSWPKLHVLLPVLSVRDWLTQCLLYLQPAGFARSDLDKILDHTAEVTPSPDPCVCVCVCVCVTCWNRSPHHHLTMKCVWVCTLFSPGLTYPANFTRACLTDFAGRGALHGCSMRLPGQTDANRRQFLTAIIRRSRSFIFFCILFVHAVFFGLGIVLLLSKVWSRMVCLFGNLSISSNVLVFGYVDADVLCVPL